MCLFAESLLQWIRRDLIGYLCFGFPGSEVVLIMEGFE